MPVVLYLRHLKKNTRSKKKIPVVLVSKKNRDHCNHLVDTNYRFYQGKSCWSCVARGGEILEMKTVMHGACDAPSSAQCC